MPSQGTVIARVYTSDAYIPLSGANVIFTQTDETGKPTLLAIKFTDSSGLTDPLVVDTPDMSASLSPGNVVRPYASINIQVSHPNYNSITAEGVQVFPGVETIQGLQLQPITPFNHNETSIIPADTQPL